MSIKKNTPPSKSKPSSVRRPTERKSFEKKSFETAPRESNFREQRPRQVKTTEDKSKTAVETQTKKQNNKALSASQKKHFRTCDCNRLFNRRAIDNWIVNLTRGAN